MANRSTDFECPVSLTYSSGNYVTCTIKTRPKEAGNLHSIYYKLGNGSYSNAFAKVKGGTHNINIPKSWFNRNNGILTIQVDSYDSNNKFLSGSFAHSTALYNSSTNYKHYVSNFTYPTRTYPGEICTVNILPPKDSYSNGVVYDVAINYHRDVGRQTIATNINQGQFSFVVPDLAINASITVRVTTKDKKTGSSLGLMEQSILIEPLELSTPQIILPYNYNLTITEGVQAQIKGWSTDIKDYKIIYAKAPCNVANAVSSYQTQDTYYAASPSELKSKLLQNAPTITNYYVLKDFDSTSTFMQQDPVQRNIFNIKTPSNNDYSSSDLEEFYALQWFNGIDPGDLVYLYAIERRDVYGQYFYSNNNHNQISLISKDLMTPYIVLPPAVRPVEISVKENTEDSVTISYSNPLYDKAFESYDEYRKIGTLVFDASMGNDNYNLFDFNDNDPTLLPSEKRLTSYKTETTIPDDLKKKLFNNNNNNICFDINIKSVDGLGMNFKKITNTDKNIQLLFPSTSTESVSSRKKYEIYDWKLGDKEANGTGWETEVYYVYDTKWVSDYVWTYKGSNQLVKPHENAIWRNVQGSVEGWYVYEFKTEAYKQTYVKETKTIDVNSNCKLNIKKIREDINLSSKVSAITFNIKTKYHLDKAPDIYISSSKSIADGYKLSYINGSISLDSTIQYVIPINHITNTFKSLDEIFIIITKGESTISTGIFSDINITLNIENNTETTLISANRACDLTIDSLDVGLSNYYFSKTPYSNRVLETTNNKFNKAYLLYNMDSYFNSEVFATENWSMPISNDKNISAIGWSKYNNKFLPCTFTIDTFEVAKHAIKQNNYEIRLCLENYQANKKLNKAPNIKVDSTLNKSIDLECVNTKAISIGDDVKYIIPKELFNINEEDILTFTLSPSNPYPVDLVDEIMFSNAYLEVINTNDDGIVNDLSKGFIATIDVYEIESKISNSTISLYEPIQLIDVLLCCFDKNRNLIYKSNNKKRDIYNGKELIYYTTRRWHNFSSNKYINNEKHKSSYDMTFSVPSGTEYMTFVAFTYSNYYGNPSIYSMSNILSINSIAKDFSVEFTDPSLTFNEEDGIYFTNSDITNPNVGLKVSSKESSSIEITQSFINGGFNLAKDSFDQNKWNTNPIIYSNNHKFGYELPSYSPVDFYRANSVFDSNIPLYNSIEYYSQWNLLYGKELILSPIHKDDGAINIQSKYTIYEDKGDKFISKNAVPYIEIPANLINFDRSKITIFIDADFGR